MTFTLEPLKPTDFDEIVCQESQIGFRDLLNTHPEFKVQLCKRCIGRTGRLDGVIIGICGISKITDYMGEGWAYFSDLVLTNPIRVVKEIRKFLKSQTHIRRIYCTVDVHNAKAIRFAETLGFKFEGILQAYGPEGHDHAMFTIINRNLEWETR